MIRSLFNQIVGFRMAEISQQADPPYVNGSIGIGSLMSNLNAANVFVSVKPGETERGFKAVWTEIERVKRYGFAQTELDRAKKNFIQSVESTRKELSKIESDSYVQKYLQHFLLGTVAMGIDDECDFYKKNIEGITLAEVSSLSKDWFVDTNRDILVMGMDKDAEILPNEATITQWIDQVRSSNIAAYIDQTTERPLMVNKPTSGKVTGIKELKDIGVTELKLSNGVKIILKPTNFKNDEILIRAFSPGGSSLYSDADYQSASNAATIVASSGLSGYNALQLTKSLSDKNVGVSPFIGERSEGFSGSSSVRDFEVALQLIYLYFTQPQKDDEVFKGIISKQSANLTNRRNDPIAVFNDTISTVLGNYNVRRTGPNMEKLKQIDIDRAYSIYKERFADASDFTFLFTGNFDVKQIVPLMEQYIGALPSVDRREKPRNLGIKIPRGVITKEVKKNLEQKSEVRLLFSGNYKYCQSENNNLDALAEVLSIKLIERLREAESGVYDVSASARYNKSPENFYTMVVAFGCAPENVDKLIGSVMEVVQEDKDKWG